MLIKHCNIFQRDLRCASIQSPEDLSRTKCVVLSRGSCPVQSTRIYLRKKTIWAATSRLLLILPQVPKRIQTSGKQARGILFMTHHQYFRCSKIFTVSPTEGQTHLQQQQMNHRIAGWFGSEATSKPPPNTP